MGCGSSKEENPDEIKSEMKKTLIPEYDAVAFFPLSSSLTNGF